MSLPAPDDAAATEAAQRPLTIGSLALRFQRLSRVNYPLGDPRRVTNVRALRSNVRSWHKDDGIPLAEIAKSIDYFWAGHDQYVSADGEPWRRFINIFARMHSKATAPDITDPAYYTDRKQRENIEWTEEAWKAHCMAQLGQGA